MAITERQRARRAEGIGASEVAALLGLDPFKTAADVIAEKRGMLTPSIDDFPSEAAEIGTYLEDGVARLVARRLDRPIVKPTGTYKLAGTRLFANLDRQIDRAARGCAPVEIKTSGREGEWGDPNGPPIEVVPQRVTLQVQTQMLCAGADHAFIGTLLWGYGGSKTVAVYRMPLVPEIADQIVETVDAIWKRYIEGDERLPPTAQGCYSESVLARIERQAGKTIAIDPGLVATYLTAQAVRKDAEAAEDGAKAALLTALDDAEAATATLLDGPRLVKFSAIKTKRLDGKALEAAHPDIAAKFTIESEYRRLTVGKAK